MRAHFDLRSTQLSCRVTKAGQAEAEPFLKRAQDLEAQMAAQVALWQSYMASGTAAHQKGKYTEAETKFEAGIAIAEGFQPEGQHLTYSLNNLAALYEAQGRYAQPKATTPRPSRSTSAPWLLIGLIWR